MFRYSEADVRKVRCVQFGILGPEELKTSSVIAITTDRTFENGRPVPGGLMDPALGAIDRGMPCASCGMDEQECPGHFGHLELGKPMYHISFLNTTLKTLRCVCFSCSVILGDEPPVEGQMSLDKQRIEQATKKKNPVQRLRAVMDIAKTKTMCWSCSAPQPNFRRDGLMINAEFKEATDVRRRRLGTPACSTRHPALTPPNAARPPPSLTGAPARAAFAGARAQDGGVGRARPRHPQRHHRRRRDAPGV